jgi:voltage-gated potassium channel Kch
MTSTTPTSIAPNAGSIGVVGNGPLARGILDELRDGGLAVTAFEKAPTHAELAPLACLVLADDDDDGNVGVALHARQAQPDLPLVVRVFDPFLEKYLEKTSPDISVLSMSGVATPGLVQFIDQARTSTVGLASWLRGFTGKVDRLLLAGLWLMLALALGGTLFFSAAMELSYVDAFYFVITTITTTGYGDITATGHSTLVKLAAAACMVLGTAAFTLFFAVVSEWVFARRMDIVLGRVPTRWSNHVVLVGAGNMSARLAGVLHGRGQRALVIEHDADNPLVRTLQSQGHQVLIADATNEASLRLAGADRACAIFVLTDQDARNLHIALVARSVSESATICARIDSPPLAHHVTANSSIRASSPVHAAARAFALEATRVRRNAKT